MNSKDLEKVAKNINGKMEGTDTKPDQGGKTDLPDLSGLDLENSDHGMVKESDGKYADMDPGIVQESDGDYVDTDPGIVKNN